MRVVNIATTISSTWTTRNVKSSMRWTRCGITKVAVISQITDELASSVIVK